jgi:RNA polymerase sigma-70 factor (ECF subfamily)
MAEERSLAMQFEAVAARVEDLDDGALVELACRSDRAAFREIMQRHNRQLFRVARSVLRHDGEAEDVVQEAYVRAFSHLGKFRGEARLSTWLTRVVLNEALGRLRQRRPVVDLACVDSINDQGEARVLYLPSARQDSDPEAAAARADVRRLLERAVDRLPDPFRTVFVLRDIEEMSVEETASHLGLRPETVKTRLHRARRLLRQSLNESLSSALADVFPCAGARCARITQAVLQRIPSPEPAGQ